MDSFWNLYGLFFIFKARGLCNSDDQRHSQQVGWASLKHKKGDTLRLYASGYPHFVYLRFFGNSLLFGRA